MQYVARVSSQEIRQEGADVGDQDVRGSRDDDHNGLCSLRAAPARHAGRRTRAIVASGQFVACARLVDDEAGDTGCTERQ